MAGVAFPWRPLGRLLVERGALTAAQLERALAEQRRTGAPLGRILVGQGWVSVLSLTGALAEQHGVVLRGDDAPQPPERPAESRSPKGSDETWTPLGRLLVEKGLVDSVQLKQALAEQREQGTRLGEILVERDWITAAALAQAVAEQHGLELDEESALRARPGPSADGRFEVRELRGQDWEILHTSPTFLDATDVAFELLRERDPEVLEIVRADGPVDEVVWSFRRADAEAAPGDPFDRYGYPVTAWKAAPWLSRKTGPADDADRS